MLAMEFNDWLLNCLNEKGWNQSELATRAGVTRTAISDVISGRRNPGPNLCLAISRALNLPPETVFRAAGLLPAKPAATQKLDEAAYILSMLGEDDLEEIIQIARLKLERQKTANKKVSRKVKPPAQSVLIEQ